MLKKIKSASSVKNSPRTSPERKVSSAPLLQRTLSTPYTGLESKTTLNLRDCSERKSLIFHDPLITYKDEDILFLRDSENSKIVYCFVVNDFIVDGKIIDTKMLIQNEGNRTVWSPEQWKQIFNFLTKYHPELTDQINETQFTLLQHEEKVLANTIANILKSLQISGKNTALNKELTRLLTIKSRLKELVINSPARVLDSQDENFFIELIKEGNIKGLNYFLINNNLINLN